MHLHLVQKPRLPSVVSAPRLPRTTDAGHNVVALRLPNARTSRPPSRSTPKPEAIARRSLTAIRMALGLLFVACGLNGLFDFLPRHSALNAGASGLGGALLLAGSMFPLLKGAEVLVAALLDWYEGSERAAS